MQLNIFALAKKSRSQKEGQAIQVLQKEPKLRSEGNQLGGKAIPGSAGGHLPWPCPNPIRKAPTKAQSLLVTEPRNQLPSWGARTHLSKLWKGMSKAMMCNAWWTERPTLNERAPAPGVPPGHGHHTRTILYLPQKLNRNQDPKSTGLQEQNISDSNVWASYIIERKGQVAKGTVSTYVRHGTEQRNCSEENSKFTNC